MWRVVFPARGEASRSGFSACHELLHNQYFQAVFDRRYVKLDETVINEIKELDIDGDLKEELRSISEIEKVKKQLTR
jgi:hypothetical protein